LSEIELLVKELFKQRERDYLVSKVRGHAMLGGRHRSG